MNKLMKKIDMFCYKHPRFGIPNLMLIIVFGNLAVWFISMMDTTNTLMSMLAFSPGGLFRGEVWRLVTFVFVPEQRSFWLILILYLYYWIGSSLEREWGNGRFTIFYLCGMLVNVLFSIAVYLISGADNYITATMLNLSMFFAFATLYPDMSLLLFFIIPVKIKYLAILNAFFFVVTMLRSLIAGLGLISLLPLICMLNYFIFCGDLLMSYVRNYFRRARPQTINFKKTAAKMKRDEEKKPYRHKCDVCGKTDVDYPDLEFRYCSLCKGYHCFCIDHINSHIHFNE